METLSKTEPLKELQNIIGRLGWYSGKSQLLITYEGSFEGFYGLASEDWEQQAVIELKEVKTTNDKIICPAIKVKGNRFESIEDIAKKVLSIYEKWSSENK